MTSPVQTRIVWRQYNLHQRQREYPLFINIIAVTLSLTVSKDNNTTSY